MYIDHIHMHMHVMSLALENISKAGFHSFILRSSTQIKPKLIRDYSVDKNNVSEYSSEPVSYKSVVIVDLLITLFALFHDFRSRKIARKFSI